MTRGVAVLIYGVDDLKRSRFPAIQDLSVERLCRQHRRHPSQLHAPISGREASKTRGFL